MLSPLCSAGTSVKLAVRRSLGGPATVADGLFDSGRPSSVQMAPLEPQAVVVGSVIVTASRPDGSTWIVHA